VHGLKELELMAFLYITEQGAVLMKKGQRLVVEKDGSILFDIPANKVKGVLIFGNVQVTTQAIHLALELEIELALFSYHGRLLGQLTPPAGGNVALRQAQYARKGDPGFTLAFSRVIVAGKLANALAFVREFAHNHPETGLQDEVKRLEAVGSQVEGPEDLPELLGFEGTGARIYFEAFAKMVRHSFSFDGRHRRPPSDPVNALLSLGYTMVYNEIGSLLDGMGFDPYLGFFHQPHYGHATLASDLLEEFRAPLVDRFTLGLINNRVFQEQDFYLHTASGGVMLKDEPRKRYFAEYEHFVTRSMKTLESEKEIDFRRLFRRQAERLREAVSGDQTYCPYTLCW
jgi:CRISPR-associated protein Cas1